MKQLNQYITEKFKVSSKNIKKKLKDVSNVDYKFLNNSIYFNNAKEERDYDKIVKKRKSKNDYKFLKDTKQFNVLLIYWYLSITNGWLEASMELKEEILKRSDIEEDELNAYILSKYKKVSGFKETEKNMEEYLDENNIKYEKNETT